MMTINTCGVCTFSTRMYFTYCTILYGGVSVVRGVFSVKCEVTFDF